MRFLSNWKLFRCSFSLLLFLTELIILTLRNSILLLATVSVFVRLFFSHWKLCISMFVLVNTYAYQANYSYYWIFCFSCFSVITSIHFLFLSIAIKDELCDDYCLKTGTIDENWRTTFIPIKCKIIIILEFYANWTDRSWKIDFLVFVMISRITVTRWKLKPILVFFFLNFGPNAL